MTDIQDEIITLSPLQHVRKRSGVYCGDTSNSNQLVLEVFANALDCYNAGYGNTITVLIKNGIITCQDEGPGFEVNEIRDDGTTTLEAAMSIMNTSGKFSDDGLYQGTSLGLNGMGAKICTFLSHWLEVITYKDGQTEHLWFKEGVLSKRELGTCEQTKSGTTVSFQPSEEFFDNPNPNLVTISNFFNDIACLCPGLTIIFNDKKISHDGIKDLLDNKIGNAVEIINNQLIFNETLGKQSFNLGMSFTSSSSSNITPYVNCGNTDTGPHITAIKSTITRVFNNWAKENDILKKDDKNLEGSNIQEGLVLVCNITSPSAAYNAQVKTTITKIDTSFITQVLSKQLELWLDNNPGDGKNVIEKALTARKAAEAAKKARAKVKNEKNNKSNKIKILHPDKLKDAEYLGQDSTLLVVEGLSAGASMAVARDRSHYGILMLRGKLINAFSNSKEKLAANEEIQLLLKALNVDPSNYDSSKLRYGRVAIAVDSDSDGYHIALLVTTAIQHFCPDFITEQRLCWLRSPLYIVKNGKQEQYYFTDEEMNAVRGTIKGEVQRNKGLGSLSAEQAKVSMFGPNQRMDILNPNDEAITLLKNLMGSSGVARKDFVFNNIDFSTIRE